jgi:hypothetical protein
MLITPKILGCVQSPPRLLYFGMDGLSMILLLGSILECFLDKR